MESKDELKEIDIENRTCCYCQDTIRVIKFVVNKNKNEYSRFLQR